MAKKKLTLPLEARALLLAPLSLFTWVSFFLIGLMGAGIAGKDVSAHSGQWFLLADAGVGGALASIIAGWTISRFDGLAQKKKRTGFAWLYFLAASPFGLPILWRLQASADDNAPPLLIFVLPFLGCAAGLALHRRFRR